MNGFTKENTKDATHYNACLKTFDLEGSKRIELETDIELGRPHETPMVWLFANGFSASQVVDLSESKHAMELCFNEYVKEMQAKHHIELEVGDQIKSAHDEMPHAISNSEPTKPVYTKEMNEAGELPPVGVECIFSYADVDLLNGLKIGDAVKVIAHFDNNRTPIAVFTHECDNSNGQGVGMFVSMGGLDSFSPINTRSDEEKLRDDILFYINDGGVRTIEDAIEKAFDKFTIALKALS